MKHCTAFPGLGLWLRRSWVAGCLIFAAHLRGADAATDLAAVRSLLAERTERAKSAVAATPSESSRWMSDFSNRVCVAALRVYENHPADPLRWEAALIALKTLRSYVTEVKPGYDEAIAARDTAKIQTLIVRDEAARVAWEQRMDALERELFAAADVPSTVLAEAYANAVYRVSLRRGASPAERWTAMQPLLEALDRRVTDPAMLTRAYEVAVRTVQTADPAAYAEFLRNRSQSPIPEVSRWASGKANVQAAKTAAVEMKFTAIDGREVDLAKLRGKVVLIDFWATWCGPCKEELPNILAAFRKYHAQGFEVIGVSLDSEKDKAKLVDYCRVQGLPWPQHFDGKGMQNEFAQRFGVRAIPAMFLLDQDGKVASTEARGPRLDAEINRLLARGQAAAAPERPTVGGMLGAGAMAPEFSSFDLAGREVKLADFRGRVLILDFWATWCGPCIASMPHTQEIAAKYADQGVAVLAVCTGDKRKKFEDWVMLKAKSYPALRFTFDPHEQGTSAEKDRASVALYRVPAIPTQFIIDRAGRIVGTTSGYRPGDTTLEAALAAAGVKVDPTVFSKKPAAPTVVRDTASEGGQVRVVLPAQPAAVETKAPAVRVAPRPVIESVGKVKAGDLLPDLEYHGPDGTARRLSDLRGKPLILMFATAEMIPPDFLNGALEKYGPAGVQVLALVTRDTPANYQAWLELHRTRGHRFATGLDPVPASDPRNGAVFRAFQFGAPTPFAIVVDAAGRFAGAFPWKVAGVGEEGLATLLRRCGVEPSK